MKMIELILKKRSGLEHDFKELKFIADGAANETICDYQLSAWLMAVFFKGLTKKETANLTKVMVLSGDKMNLKSFKAARVDKHSTGGVGDGVSLALAPIAAACGVIIPMMSGRGLGHTGGTLDKLESMKGFQVRLPEKYIMRQLKKTGVSMFGQTGKLAPADKKLYSLRDASCTVESLPLIVSSILSKKYAEDLNGLVLDVKYGSGAFLKDFKNSRKLAVALKSTAQQLGIKCVAILTNMEEPLGLAIGNANEMEQSIRVLRGEGGPKDFMEVLEVLAGWMIFLGKKAKSVDEGRIKARKAIASGAALEKMREIIKWQKGDIRVLDNPGKFLPKSKCSGTIKANKTGYIKKLDARTLGYAGIALGAGRTKAEDKVDFGAGIILEKKTGDKVKAGETIARVYANSPSRVKEGRKMFMKALEIGKSKVRKLTIIKEIIK
ncbi:MAG: thymidine phosphorylase [Elusimicrobiota bacterium]|nr:thymidine phosphorylase [Elusimicrobiota bacterium]